jgi:hypothetical protein
MCFYFIILSHRPRSNIQVRNILYSQHTRNKETRKIIYVEKEKKNVSPCSGSHQQREAGLLPRGPAAGARFISATRWSINLLRIQSVAHPPSKWFNNRGSNLWTNRPKSACWSEDIPPQLIRNMPSASVAYLAISGLMRETNRRPLAANKLG